MTERPLPHNYEANETRFGKTIVHLTTVHHPQDPRISHKQIPTLQAAGYDVTLLASGQKELMPSSFSTVSLPPTQTWLRRLPLQWTVYREARALDADVYHMHDPELIPVGFFLQSRLGASVIYDMHEDYWGRGERMGRLLRGLERWCFTWVDHVVIAEQMYESILDGETAFTFIGNYYKPYEGNPAPSSPATTSAPWNLLYTGSVAGHRGLFTMLDCAARLKKRERGDEITLVGVCRRSSERRRAESLIQTKQLESIVNRVGWTEYVPSSEIVSYYGEADVGLALFEPTPNHAKSLLTKFFEYLHFGLPIICTETPLWRDFIESHGCGEVVEAGNAESVVEILDRWAARPEEYRERSRAAIEAASNYRWEPMGKRLVELYDRLLEES